MKKKLCFVTLFLLSFVWLPTVVVGESQPLYKFVKTADGRLEYDTSIPVPFYKDSSEFITIPDSYTQPKNQLKSSWVATISNLNISRPSSESDFQEKYLTILNTFKEWNMNAMIFQVRPLLDTWYPSAINPWSEFLSGKQGQNPGYDPLAWMIEETHKAGLEYHAWLNPYRVTNTKLTDKTILAKTGLTVEQITALSIPEQIKALADAGVLAANNYAVLHPENVLVFDEKFFLNPGIPEVQKHVIDTVEELVTNYDIDAIHFDDYFYPYRITVNNVNVLFGAKNEDKATFEQYGAGYSNIDNWRRDNITHLVQGVKGAIDRHNQAAGTAVQFGISPFGIWEHKANDPRGSNTPTGSSQSYSTSIFADTYKWIKEETLDYVVPQIYWSFDQAAAPYGELTRWWNNVAEGSRTQVYVGHANYKHVSNGGWDASWLNPEEIANQIKFNQNYPKVAGSVLFSYNDLLPSNLDALDPTLKERHQAKNLAIDLLKLNYFNLPSLVPAKPWLSKQPVNVPKPVELVVENNITTLRWQDDEANRTRFFILYKGQGTPEEVSQNPGNIVKKIWKKPNQTTFEEQDISLLQSASTTSEYFISAVDAAGVESAAVSFNIPPVKAANVTVHYLDEQKKVLSPEVIIEGLIGEAYTTEAKIFEGYELIETPVNSTGTFSDTPQTVVYNYRATGVDSSSSNSSSDSSSDSSSNSSSDSSSNSSSDSSSNSSSDSSSNSSSNSSSSNSTTSDSSHSSTSSTYQKASNSSSSYQNGNNSHGSYPSTGESTKLTLLITGVLLIIVTMFAFIKKQRQPK